MSFVVKPLWLKFGLFRALPVLGNQGQLQFQIDATVKDTGCLFLTLGLDKGWHSQEKKKKRIAGTRA